MQNSIIKKSAKLNVDIRTAMVGAELKNKKNSNTLKNINKEDHELYVWIKTLLGVHDFLPNIIKLVDSMVTKKASSLIDSSYIFGDNKNGTLSQMEKVIDMTERKVSLLNLYAIIEDMINGLDEKYKPFVIAKFYKRKKSNYLAEEFNIDERTVYRWANTVMKTLLDNCKRKNISVGFIYSQIEREGWLLEHYNKNYKSFINNLQKA